MMADSMTENILEVKNLCKTYIADKRQNHVLRNVSLTIRRALLAAVWGYISAAA